ncbi:MAG: metal-dependent hydrolase [Bacteroidia bacterium]|nr:metal-dependent hydrolase [Bacteroidia bacterium]NNC85390.1 metal-dependent hydrolase [Bacteroidia bacterium]NNM15607.1 metal-dependent hydrolase [Bacteroidia bacterium]
MASVFGHAIAAAAIGNTSGTLSKSVKFWILAIFCCCIPDADVATFKFGIPYEHPFGHRGFTHSLFFAFVLALIIKTTFYYSVSLWSKKGITILIMFFVLTASHGVLDAMTNGGRGIAFFGPFDNTRHFLPWREIVVSPMSAAKFFGEWGIRVIKSELMWIGIPSAAFMLLTSLFRKARA